MDNVVIFEGPDDVKGLACAFWLPFRAFELRFGDILKAHASMGRALTTILGNFMRFEFLFGISSNRVEPARHCHIANPILIGSDPI
jgi:hypothetical protein